MRLLICWSDLNVKIASWVPRFARNPCCGSDSCASYQPFCLERMMQTASLHSELDTESPRYISGSLRLPLILKRQVRRAKPHVFGTVEVVQISFKTEVSSSRKRLELRAYFRGSGGMSFAAFPFLNLLKTCFFFGCGWGRDVDLVVFRDGQK